VNISFSGIWCFWRGKEMLSTSLDMEV
jgi:hypothetical protein